MTLFILNGLLDCAKCVNLLKYPCFFFSLHIYSHLSGKKSWDWIWWNYAINSGYIPRIRWFGYYKAVAGQGQRASSKYLSDRVKNWSKPVGWSTWRFDPSAAVRASSENKLVWTCQAERSWSQQVAHSIPGKPLTREGKKRGGSRIPSLFTQPLNKT